MNPALELARLLGKKNSTQTVVVVSSTPSLIKATARSGVVELKNDGSIYRAGETLVVRDSVVLGRALNEADVPLYYL